jgi:hypothetical protein
MVPCSINSVIMKSTVDFLGTALQKYSDIVCVPSPYSSLHLRSSSSNDRVLHLLDSLNAHTIFVPCKIAEVLSQIPNNGNDRVSHVTKARLLESPLANPFGSFLFGWMC